MSTLSSTPVDTEQPLKLEAWINNNQYELTKTYCMFLKQFQRLSQLLNCYIWLDHWIDLQPIFYVPNKRINLTSTFQVYDVKSGSPSGVRLGHVFRTPLQVRITDTYLLAHRSTIDAQALFREQATAERKYSIGDLLYFMLRDEAILLATVPKTKFVEQLEN